MRPPADENAVLKIAILSSEFSLSSPPIAFSFLLNSTILAILIFQQDLCVSKEKTAVVYR
jgi:hypothetical protein